jgi:2'-5' RNA ligase
LRVFVALDLPEAVHARIAALVARLQPAVRGARWAHAEGMHVTIKFIGEATPEKVERIQTELAAVRSPQPVEMRFRNVGFFPNERRPRVFWAGIEASPNLPELAAEIERRLEPLGIPREDRSFHPHLTLARLSSPNSLPALRQGLEGLAPFEFGEARIGEFHLYESRLKPSGAEYARLRSFVFVEAAR